MGSPSWTDPYPGGQFHAVVEIPKPEEVGKAVGDVKGTQFLVSQSQKPENVHIVLVSPNQTKEQPSCMGLSVPSSITVSSRGGHGGAETNPSTC